MKRHFANYGIAVICCVVVGLLSNTGSSYADLVGAWALDEGKGTDIKDSSGNMHNGIAIDPEWVDGKRGKALSFDENTESIVEIPDEDGEFTLTEYTLAAWIKASRTHAGWQAIVGKWAENEDALRNYGLWLHQANCTLGVQSYGDPKINLWPVEPVLCDDVWHHVAGTYDGSMAIVYVDGVNVGETPITSELNTTTDPVRIGKFPLAPHYFAGIIDEVAIYNNALSADEIADLMNQGLSAAVELSGKLSITWASIKQQ